MAFTASVTKQLGDLLEEQQEPFVLEVYLFDKGCRKNVVLSKRSRIFRRACRSEVLCRRRKLVSRCTKAVKALLEILGVSRKSAEGAFSRKGKRRHGILHEEDEGDVDMRIKKISEDETETQLSPVSVLEPALSNEESPVHFIVDQTIQNTKTLLEEVSSDSIYSDSYESLEGLLLGKACDVYKPDSYSQYTKVKLALQQTKQLLFDCVKEIVETQRLKNKRQCEFREPMGAEAIGKSLCENILGWSTQSVNANYSNQLFDRDVLGSVEEWNDFEQGKGIGKEIADHILEDISIDIVMDLIRV